MKSNLKFLLATLAIVMPFVQIQAQNTITYGPEGAKLVYKKLDNGREVQVFGTEFQTNEANYVIPEKLYPSEYDLTFYYDVVSVASNAFKNTYALSVVFPNSVQSIGDNAFEGCEKLKTVTLPNNSAFTTLPYRTFYNCSALEELTLPANITSVGTQAVLFCSSLKEVTLPQNLNSMGMQAFYGCTSLKKIICENSIAPTLEKYVFYNVPADCEVYVPYGSDYSSWKDAYSGFVIHQCNLVDECRSNVDFVLQDAVEYLNVSGSDIEVSSVTYNRSFPSNSTWMPLYLPFDVQYAELTASLGDDVEIARLTSISAEGEEVSMNWESVSGGTIAAKTAYILRTKTAANAIVAHNTALVAGNASESCTLVDGGYSVSLTGIFAPATINAYDQYVMAKSDGDFHQTGKDATLAPFRFYLSLTTPPTVSRISLKMLLDGEENNTDGISDLLFDSNCNGIYYDMRGVRVDNPHSGIYISNGKKKKL